MNIGWSWTLELIIEETKSINVETKFHDEYKKQPLKTFTSTTRFGFVPDGRNKRFQDYRCKDASNEWWGYFNHLHYYMIYGTLMKMFLTMLLSNLQQKKCTSTKDVHKEIHQAINITIWFSQGEKCTKLNTSNMCNV